MLSRSDLGALADRMLAAVRPFASPGHALIHVPGPAGGNGRAVDGLEGFARTFLLAGFRLAGSRGHDPHDLAGWYAAGLAAGSDPAARERWVRLTEHPQAKVEAASIALVLDLTRPWIWDRLSPSEQANLIEYLAPAVGDDTYPRINWVWFRLVVQTFLRSVGGPFSLGEMAADLATHDSFARSAGWMADGPERTFDHYVGWALHVYPALWARMAGAADLAGARRERDRQMLDRYLLDAVHLIGADGAPLAQGRSLSYRFAAAAPFWAGAISTVPSLSPGLLRRAATGIVGHFLERGALDDRGLLSTGWYGPWPALAQSYSGPGSPYWAAKGLLGLALPAEDPIWTAPAEPLPIERGDYVRAILAPGWAVSGTRADGVVRIANHGTDHATSGDAVGDSPLYARLGYSTRSFPLLDEASWSEPLDQSVVLLDRRGVASHRAGMTTLDVGVQDGVARAASVGCAHWIACEPPARNHGSGYSGTATRAADVLVVSLLRGPWELRAARIGRPSPAAVGLRFGGWCLAGPSAETTDGPAPAVVAGGMVSSLQAVLGAPTRTGVDVRADAGPLAAPSSTPWAIFRAVPQDWTAVLVELAARDRTGDGRACTAQLVTEGPSLQATVTWPDGVVTGTQVHIGIRETDGTSPAATSPTARPLTRSWQ